MKVIGLITSWGSEKWIDLVIRQALFACDEVIISIGPHSTVMNKYEDNTLEIVKKYGDRVKLVPVVNRGTHSVTKSETMNAMLKASELYAVGNWVWLLDDDEFYHYDDINKMKEIAESGEYNYIFTKEMFFYINMQHYIEVKGGRGRFWKIEGNDKFIPTNKWTGPRNKVYNYDGYMHHYSLLMNPYAKIDFWGTEYAHGQNHKIKWLKDIYLNYDLKDENKWLDKCEVEFGHRYGFPIAGDNFNGDTDGKLFKYNGPQPAIIKDSGLEEITDFRKLYEPK